LEVPAEDRGPVLNRCIPLDPFANLLVVRPGGDEGPELLRIKAGEFPKVSVQGALGELVVTTDTEEIGSALVQDAGPKHKSAQRFPRAARLGDAEVTRE